MARRNQNNIAPTTGPNTVAAGVARAATVFGPVVGAMLFWFLLAIPDALLRQAISGENPLLSLTERQFGPPRYVLLGLMIALLMVWDPQGIYGVTSGRCDSMLDADTRALPFADVPHLPGSAKPDPVLVADNVSRTFGGCSRPST